MLDIIKLKFDPDKWTFSSGNKVRTILFVANVVCLYWLFTSFSWTGLGIGIIGHILLAKIGGDIGVHRYFCHRSFRAKTWAEWLFLFLSIPISFGSPIHWIAAHRLHHAKSDTPGDPHSPHHTGSFKVWTFQLGNNWHVSPMFVKDLLRDPRQVFIFKNYFKLYSLWLAIIIAIALMFGWQWIVYLWALPITLTLHSSSAVNVICHKWGYQTYNTGEKSTNNIWLNFIVLGNAMHNNHHGKPDAYDISGDKWYEFDLWGKLIKYTLMKK